MRWLLPLWAFVVACGSRTELRGTLDATSDDGGTLSCGDASCNIPAQFCYHVGGGPPPGTSSSQCKPLPSGCHDCSCANPPQQNLVCVCSGDVGYITVSCSFP